MSLLVLKIVVVAAIVAVAAVRIITLNRRIDQDAQNGTGLDVLSPRGRMVVFILIVVVGIALILLRWPSTG